MDYVNDGCSSRRWGSNCRKHKGLIFGLGQRESVSVPENKAQTKGEGHKQWHA